MSSPDTPQATELLSSAEVGRTVARIAHQIIEKTALDSHPAPRTVLLGIPSGGVPLAERLRDKIAEFSGVEVPSGALDITLYRDDLRTKPHRALRPTTIPDGGIDGATVILVDDVLFSGRTIRAALDALMDIGRPSTVQLAVLVDRGHRQLPIRADFVGKNVPSSSDENVRLFLEEADGKSEVEILEIAPGSRAGSAPLGGE